MLVDAIYVGTSIGAKSYRLPDGRRMVFSSMYNRRTVSLGLYQWMEKQWPKEFFAVPAGHEISFLTEPVIHLSILTPSEKLLLVNSGLELIGNVLADRSLTESTIGSEAYAAIHKEILACDPFDFSGDAV